ncbi:MAG: Maf family protein [Subdoligranulum sp.]|nr:Maf family protein [Subdoligranulum sp.]MCI7543146.1 Maf family protein [Subdoligranulum sp.]MDD7265691.1 Maf family protein [Subdoligranulum sp.]
MKQLILASGSPRRKELLALVTPDFTVKVSDVDESAITAPTPAGLAKALARAKCLAVAETEPEALVLGSDTVVEFEGEVFGKPKNRQDAQRMLQALSGKRHYVHTGVCMAQGDHIENFVVSSAVDFFPIEEADLQGYIDTKEPYDKAGGYAIQGHAAVWCKGIEGCYYNIMGLPVSQVAQALKKF